MMSPAKIVNLAERRESRSLLQMALAAVERHLDLNNEDRDIIKRLGAYATPSGFFDLYRPEQMAVTGASKSRLKSAVKRATAAGLLHLTDGSTLFCLTESAISPEAYHAAQRLFYAKAAFEQYALALSDTATKAQDAEWYAERIGVWLGQNYEEADIINAVLHLKHMGYFRLGIIESGDAGQITVRFEPCSLRDFAAARKRVTP